MRKRGQGEDNKRKERKRGQGEGSIRKRKDGTREVRLTIGVDPETGKQKQISKYFKTREAARDWLAKAVHERATGAFVEPNKVTLKEWLDRWMEVYQKPKVAPTTYEMRQTLIRLHIEPVLGKAPLMKLRPSDLQDLYAGKLAAGRIDGRGLSSQTVRHIHNILNPALKQAMKEGLVARNVAQATAPPKLIRLQEMRPLKRDEVARFLAAIREDRLYVAFLVEISTGLRRGELLGLKWEDIDLQKGTLQVRRSLARVKPEKEVSRLVFQEPKTPNSRRLIPLPEETTRELKTHKARQAQERLFFGQAYQDNGLVFATEDGRPIDPRNFIRRYTLLLKKAGIEHTRFHNLRHTFATLLLEMDEHPKVVQEILGHSKISQTLDTYSHMVPGLKERAAAKLNDILKMIPKTKLDTR
jgi:integrase